MSTGDDKVEFESLDELYVQASGGDRSELSDRVETEPPARRASSTSRALPPDRSPSNSSPLAFEGLEAVADELLSQPPEPSLSSLETPMGSDEGPGRLPPTAPPEWRSPPASDFDDDRESLSEVLSSFGDPAALMLYEDEDDTAVMSAMPTSPMVEADTELATPRLPSSAFYRPSIEPPTSKPTDAPASIKRLSSSVVRRAVAAAESKRLTVAPRVDEAPDRTELWIAAAVCGGILAVAGLAWFLAA